MKGGSTVLRKSFSISNLGIVAAYFVVFVGLSIANPHFLSLSNFLVILRQSIFTMIVGFAMTFVIAMGEIDLSVGSIVGITGIFAGALVIGKWNILFVIFLPIAIGALIGLINGLLITKVRIAFFIATLATMGILRGFIYVYSKGIPLYGLSAPGFLFIGEGYVGFMPFPIIITLLIMALCLYLFKRTKFGRYSISIGSNESAAEMVGINVDRVKVLVFMLSGVLCAITGIIFASRNEAAVPDAGTGWELDAIAATVIGGTSLSGGKGYITGTAFGALLMATIRAGLSFVNINTLWNQVVVGGFILATVAFDSFASRRSHYKR
jgi:ribose transport system permease protein